MKTSHLAKFTSLVLCILVLTSCVSRQDADQKLGKACEAAAGVFRTEGFTVKSVKKVDAKVSKEFGSGYRQIKVFVTESDSWLDVDKEYNCVFAEEFGILNSSFTADLYQIEVDNQVYGMKDNTLMGGTDIHLKLMRAVASELE